MHFLSINLISFHWSCGIVLVMGALAREMDSLVDSEIHRNMRKMLGIQVLKVTKWRH